MLVTKKLIIDLPNPDVNHAAAIRDALRYAADLIVNARNDGLDVKVTGKFDISYGPPGIDGATTYRCLPPDAQIKRDL
jgi:hypothetical protein